MFRTVQKFQCAGFSDVIVSTQEIKDNVVVVNRLKAKDTKPLPPLETFDLEKMIEAKVNLTEVSCRLEPKSFDVNAFSKASEKRSKKATKTQTTKGVENNE